ncbi:MAG: PKD domain-containing protein [Bacteroidales bacterium]|nr:PKD domain-containing protein [Bacteroidales bacterium]
MKKPVCLLLLCFLFLQHAQAQNNTAGTDFWVTYQDTRSQIFDTLNDISISISSLYNTSGKICFTQSKDTIPFQVNAFGTFRYTVQGLQRQYCINKNHLGKDNVSIHITSDMPVIVSTHSYRCASADATQIYPTPTWGNTYYVINPLQQQSSMDWMPGTMIVADQDSTVIYADQTLIDTLHRGDTYHGFFPTGTRISGNKPIGVFSADALMMLISSGDCLLTQLQPICSISTSYFIPVTSFKREYIQVLATQNNTNVVAIRGKTVTTPPHPYRNFNMGVTHTDNLKKGEWFWMEIYRDSLDSACYIQADKPIIVTSQMTSQGHNIPSYMSDPSKTWVASVAQRTDSVLVSPFTIIHYDTQNLSPYNMAIIICSTIDKDSTRFNINGGKDTALYGGTWINHPSGFSYYDMSLSTDSNTYLFVNNAGGLIVYLYGVGRAQSYYMQSAKLTNLLSAFYGNSIFYADLPDHFFCEQEITFTSNISGDTGTMPGHIKWYIDSVEVNSARDQNSWSRYFSQGTYTIEMEVMYADNRNSQRIASILHVVDLQAELHSTPEHCNQADGTIICSANSAFPQQVVYILDSNTYKQDTIRGLTAGWYHVSISDSVCLLEQDIFIDSIGGPLAEFEAIPATATVNYAVYFHDQSTDPYAPICSWHWDMGDSHSDSIQNPNHIFTAEGAYNVTLLVTDTNGCSDSISHVVNIVRPFFFPNIFTPIGSDGTTYYFRPVEDKGLFDVFEMTVYNRWGTVVWQQSCEDGQCPHYSDDLFWWDGRDSNGKRVSDGVYYWTAKAYSKNMPPILQQGSVTVTGNK